MIDRNEGIIIVMGMAHSGTTILAYLLKQHPDVFCFVDANPAFLLENTLLPEHNRKKIRSLLRTKPNKRILLKRPWATYHTDWLLSEMPNAKYIYCQRSFEEIAISWSKPGSYISGALRDGTVEFQQSHYDNDLRRSEEFATRAKYFKRFHHEKLLANPSAAMNALGKWLGLSVFEWDVSKVSKENIKAVIQESIQPEEELRPVTKAKTEIILVQQPVKNTEIVPASPVPPIEFQSKSGPRVVKSKLSRNG